MFDGSLPTRFGPVLQMHMTGLFQLPSDFAMDVAGSRERLGARVAVPLHAPAELVQEAAKGEGSVTRMVWLPDEDAIFGVAMVHKAGHFAASLLDLGDSLAGQLAQEGLRTKKLLWFVHNHDDAVVVAPALTGPSRRMFKKASNGLQPASFDQFSRRVASVVKSLAESETYEAMGVDPALLKSITLSVCVPHQQEACPSEAPHGPH